MTRTPPLARWSTAMRRAWGRLRDFRTVRIEVHEGGAVQRPASAGAELLHWAGDGPELHGWFLPPPRRYRPRRALLH
jgi:hypothetical protein